MRRKRACYYAPKLRLYCIFAVQSPCKIEPSTNGKEEVAGNFPTQPPSAYIYTKRLSRVSYDAKVSQKTTIPHSPIPTQGASKSLPNMQTPLFILPSFFFLLLILPVTKHIRLNPTLLTHLPMQLLRIRLQKPGSHGRRPLDLI